MQIDMIITILSQLKTEKVMYFQKQLKQLALYYRLSCIARCKHKSGALCKIIYSSHDFYILKRLQGELNPKLFYFCLQVYLTVVNPLIFQVRVQ